MANEESSLALGQPFRRCAQVLKHGAMDALPGCAMPPASVQGLLDLLEKAEGSVQVLDPSEEVRAAWRRLVHAVPSGGHIQGWHLVHRGRNTGDLGIELRRGRHPSKQYQPGNRS
ncbi:hypothetical protein AB0877_00890 [Micromonospora sp. NPDC047644]|uniref:hypothetical protein n=1 Tax=Micromonospora sp. NPDC047644 TaxID=3157203 RepID=UPI003456C834